MGDHMRGTYALEALQHGSPVRRKSWDRGEKLVIGSVPRTEIAVMAPLYSYSPSEFSGDMMAPLPRYQHGGYRTILKVSGHTVAEWQPTCADLLAKDWEAVS